MLSLWFGAYDQGLAYAGLALGTLLTLRILNFADLTVDGSFALGGGAAAGRLAVRILKGESPATMPFEPLSKTTLLLNGATAKAIGVSLPQALLQQADTLVKP